MKNIKFYLTDFILYFLKFYNILRIFLILSYHPKICQGAKSKKKSHPLSRMGS